MIEQLGRGTLRPHQRRLDLVLLRQPEQVFGFHQSTGTRESRVLATSMPGDCNNRLVQAA
jgi:hypothetical protein